MAKKPDGTFQPPPTPPPGVGSASGAGRIWKQTTPNPMMDAQREREAAEKAEIDSRAAAKKPEV